MKTMVASAIFLIVGISSVLACTAAYWPAGPDYIAPFTCPNDFSLYKESFWSVKYPEQVGFTDVTSSGGGGCSPSLQCWPNFYPPEALDNLWRQKVDSRTVCHFPDRCCFWFARTYPMQMV